jgi:hypothetical protein
MTFLSLAIPSSFNEDEETADIRPFSKCILRHSIDNTWGKETFDIIDKQGGMRRSVTFRLRNLKFEDETISSKKDLDRAISALEITFFQALEMKTETYINGREIFEDPLKPALLSRCLEPAELELELTNDNR